MASRLDEWLKTHELAEYRDTFVEQDVRMSDLPHLTEVDLKELGLPIGARRRLLVAISELGVELPAARETHFDTKVSDHSEVRHLTLMFADLVGSTQLSEDLDIESYRNLINNYQSICSIAVERHQGHLAQFQGDGVVAYFGYPSAEENDAERAVFTGLEICRAIASLTASSSDPIMVRVGIATGDVVIDSREGHRVHALGEAPNLAARIQAVTAPGTVVVSDDTKALLGANFDCELGGEHKLKGLSEPVRIWTVHNASEPELRFHSRQHGKITPIIGREDELLLLESRWKTAQQNGSQVVMLCGEAGIGKSRLVEELSNRIPREDRLRLSFQCLPNHGGSVFHPVVGFISHAARISRTDDAEQRLEKLRGLLSEWTDDTEAMLPVFARLLSIQRARSSQQPDTPPEQLKEQLQDAMIHILRALAEKRPLLILFEDLHWIDPSSEDLVDILIERLKGVPILMLCTFRPDYKARWLGLARMTSITISRLENRHSRQMVRSMIEQMDFPPKLETQIIAKTEGVPLFIEEMTRMVGKRLVDAHSEASNVSALALPATLKDLLRAQIDNLSTPQDFVSICAAIGRSISPAMLREVTGQPTNKVKRLLDQLTEAQILIRRRGGDGTSYAFRHALIQDAVYDLILPSRARALHQRIAETIAEKFPEIATRMPDQLAYHFTLSGVPAEARDAWRKAAERAARLVATEETIHHLQAALSENGKIEDEDERDAQELVLRRLLNVALNTYAFGSQQVRENRDRLHQLLRKTSASAQDMFLALIVQYGTQLMLGETESALELCFEMRQIADATGDPTMAAFSAHSKGMTHFMSASFDEAIRHFDEALELREGIAPAQFLTVYAADIRPVDIAMRAWALVCHSGEPSELQNALEAIWREPHDFSHCYALSILAAAYQMVDDVEAVIRLSEAALEISDDRNFQYWSAWNAILHGWAVARSGDPSAGIKELAHGIDDYLATGSTQMTLYARTLLADAWRVAGDFETGLATIATVRADPLAKSIRYQNNLTDSVEAELNAASSEI